MMEAKLPQQRRLLRRRHQHHQQQGICSIVSTKYLPHWVVFILIVTGLRIVQDASLMKRFLLQTDGLNSVTKTETTIDYDALPCTFEQLEETYGTEFGRKRRRMSSLSSSVATATNSDIMKHSNTNATATTINSTNNNNECWKLSEEILRIPSSAILNWGDNLIPLGSGCNGGVYKVILQLKSKNATAASSEAGTVDKIATTEVMENVSSSSSSSILPSLQCSATLKVDLVHTGFCPRFFSDPFEILKDPVRSFRLANSCFKAHWMGFTHLGAEYTGAMPFYAARQTSTMLSSFSSSSVSSAASVGGSTQGTDSTTNNFPQGLIPTWAVVQRQQDSDNDHDTASLSKKTLRRTYPKHTYFHYNAPPPDKRIIGVLMPFAPIKSIQSLQQSANAKEELPSSIQNMTTQIMMQKFITAVEGLAYVHELGLAFQDLGTSNVAFGLNLGDKSLTHGIVYDNTYMGWQRPQDHTCTLGQACNVCSEQEFPPHYKGIGWNHWLQFNTTYKGPPNDVMRFKTSIVFLLSLCTDRDIAESLTEQVQQCQTSSELLEVLRERQ